jgi:hypothetical protein
MKIYHITLICAAGRYTQNVIAQNAMRATQIALNMLPDVSVQFAIICKPVMPCAA